MSHPRPRAGTTLLTVLSIDLTGDLAGNDSIAISGDGGVVYATGRDLFVADSRMPFTIMPAERAPGRTQEERTRLYQFDTSGPGAPRFVASGVVQGTLLNQYSLSEHDGHLRVATTDHGEGWAGREQPTSQPASQSAVTVLRRDGDRLVEAGRIGGLGKGERIYSVRFLGEVGYVVTFRETDPLYRLDLSDPAHPRITGELKITGYSAYLHPVDDGRLLGIGQEATGQGRVTGTQISLFDDGDSPRRLARYHVPNGHSEVEFDPHAFLYWPDTATVVLPVSVWDAAEAHPGSRAVVLRLVGDEFSRVGSVRHPGVHAAGLDIRRSLVVGDTLWTVSDAGVMANDLGDLGRLAWVPFV